MTKIDYKADFEGFRKTAEDMEWYPAIDVIGAAEENANDTYGHRNDNNDALWYECAYDSICQTAAFNENEAVRKVFAHFGYSW